MRSLTVPVGSFPMIKMILLSSDPLCMKKNLSIKIIRKNIHWKRKQSHQEKLIPKTFLTKKAYPMPQKYMKMIVSVLQATLIPRRKNLIVTKYVHPMVIFREILMKRWRLLKAYQKMKRISVKEHIFLRPGTKIDKRMKVNLRSMNRIRKLLEL